MCFLQSVNPEHRWHRGRGTAARGARGLGGGLTHAASSTARYVPMWCCLSERLTARVGSSDSTRRMMLCLMCCVLIVVIRYVACHMPYSMYHVLHVIWDRSYTYSMPCAVYNTLCPGMSCNVMSCRVVSRQVVSCRVVA